MPDILEQLSMDYFTDYQREWILDESPMKLAEKSRRIGWTYATSFRRVLKAMRVPELDCWVSTRDLSTAKEFVRDCRRWVRLANLVGKVGFAADQVIDTEKNITAQVLSFPNGSRIYVLTSNPDALAGKGGDIVIDEMALHKDQQLLWQVALPTASVWGYQIEVISTHRGKNTLFNKFCQDAKRANKMGWKFYSVNIVQACARGLIDRINAATAKRGIPPLTAEQFLKTQRARCATEGQWNQEFMCQPQDDLGSLLTYALIGGVSVPWPELEAEPGFILGNRYIGMDVARKRDLSVIWIIEQYGGIAWTRKIVTLRDTKLREQRRQFCQLFRDWSCSGGGIDATGIGTQLAEDAIDELGTGTVEAVTFTHQTQTEMANIMVQEFEDLTVRVPEDRTIEEGLHKVVKAVTAHGNITYVAPSDEDGHADEFWALALALRAARQSLGPARAMRIVSEDELATAALDNERPNNSSDYIDVEAEWSGIGVTAY